VVHDHVIAAKRLLSQCSLLNSTLPTRKSPISTMQPPTIPVIQDDELLDAVSALTRAACVMRALFLHVAEGESAVELLQKHDDLTTLAEAVIEKWRNHLGIDIEDALSDIANGLG
jgi:hypothetical protein